MTKSVESEILEWLAHQRPPSSPAAGVKLGIGDDMAIIDTAASDVLITTDMLLDGVHFDLAEHGFEAVGRKAVACSLSDCAAMAVKPIAATVSLALPTQTRLAEVELLYRGMRSLTDRFDCPIVGGDTTSWAQRFAVDVAMLAVPYDGIEPVRRDNARVGDALFVTGALGGSLLGAHMDFTPRVLEAKRVAECWGANLHAMMDLSDGLSLDLHRMCSASGVGALLDAALVERIVSDAARRAAAGDGRSPLDHALADGEDFELLMAADVEAADESIDGVDLHHIGRVTASGVSIRGVDGRTTRLEPRGFEHLR